MLIHKSKHSFFQIDETTTIQTQNCSEFIQELHEKEKDICEQTTKLKNLMESRKV